MVTLRSTIQVLAPINWSYRDYKSKVDTSTKRQLIEIISTMTIHCSANSCRLVKIAQSSHQWPVKINHQKGVSGFSDHTCWVLMGWVQILYLLSAKWTVLSSWHWWKLFCVRAHTLWSPEGCKQNHFSWLIVNKLFSCDWHFCQLEFVRIFQKSRKWFFSEFPVLSLRSIILGLIKAFQKLKYKSQILDCSWSTLVDHDPL